MNVNQMDLETLVNRWEDRREIQNLMGRYTYALLMKEEKDVFDTFWCRKAVEPRLAFNDGTYIGCDAIRAYYEALHRKNLLRTSLIRKDFREKADADGLSEEELYGCGVLEHKPLSNQILEIAEDGKTAKGFWYCVGKTDEYGIAGPLSCWTFGMFGVDFVWEDDRWRIWHLVYEEDIHSPCGESWAVPAKERPAVELYRPMEEFEMPAYSEARKRRVLYSPDRPFTAGIPLPEPYGAFADTFSYGC